MLQRHSYTEELTDTIIKAQMDLYMCSSMLQLQRTTIATDPSFSMMDELRSVV